MRNLFRIQYKFTTDIAAYERFLRHHFMETTPNYYGIAQKTKIDTPDGVMCKLRLITTLDDPSLDVVAECCVNNQVVYLWNNYCWAVAQDEHGNSQYTVEEHDRPPGPLPTVAYFNKTVVVYPIGRPS